MSQHNPNKLKQARRLHKAEKFAEAITLYRKLLKRDPANGELFRALGQVFRDAKQYNDAIHCLNQAVVLGIRDAALFTALAEIMHEQGRFAEAENMARAAVTLAPDNAGALRSLLGPLFAQGKYGEALPHGRQLLAACPDNATDHLQFARINACVGLYSVALEHADKAIALKPSNPDALHFISQVLMDVRQWDEALEMIDQALALAPGNPAFIAMKAHILEHRGQFDAAHALVTPLLDKGGHSHVNAVHVHARLAKRFGETETALAHLSQCLQRPTLSVGMRHTSLNLYGNLLDAQGRHDEAFAAIDEGNRIRPNFFSEEDHIASIEHLIALFTPERMARLPAADHGSARPVFIVGMPRSGTSLTEKILARHPAVSAGGELPHIVTLLRNDLPQILDMDKPFPDYLDELTAETANLAAGNYLSKTQSLATADASRITDKMPMNYMFLGLISLLFPRAKIIHCTRHPLATGLSCYFANFASATDLGFSQDLVLIGNYFRRYEKLMAHWHAVLPQPILDLSYESLVSHPDVEIPKLLEFCDLPWHDDCLNPHKAADTTMTASYNQVRSPINTNSVVRWKRYEKHLAPLKEALGLADSAAA